MAEKNYFEGATQVEGGIVFNGFNLEPVVEKCDGCGRSHEFEGAKYCSSYAQPVASWKHAACNLASNVKASLDKGGKVKINPLKASKRAAKGR